MASSPPTPNAPGLTLLPVRHVPVSRPLQWLRLGWRDFRRAWSGMLKVDQSLRHSQTTHGP